MTTKFNIENIMKVATAKGLRFEIYSSFADKYGDKTDGETRIGIEMNNGIWYWWTQNTRSLNLATMKHEFRPMEYLFFCQRYSQKSGQITKGFRTGRKAEQKIRQWIEEMVLEQLTEEERMEVRPVVKNETQELTFDQLTEKDFFNYLLMLDLFRMKLWKSKNGFHAIITSKPQNTSFTQVKPYGSGGWFEVRLSKEDIFNCYITGQFFKKCRDHRYIQNVTTHS